MSAPLISLRDLRFSYPKNPGEPVLRGLTLDIADGEIFALLGPNGGGKTTLFRILSTLLPPGGGRVFVCGEDIAANPRAARRKMGVLFQHPALDNKLKAVENLRCGGHMHGMRGGRLEARIRSVAEAVGLADRLGDPAETLSGGMRRRLEIAKALLPEPRFLLLDEPSTGLDPVARNTCWKLYRELQGRGVGVVLTTHIMEEAEKADAVGILHRGSLVAHGAPAALRASLGEFVLVVRLAQPAAGPGIEQFLKDAGPPGSRVRAVGGEIRALLPAPHEAAAALHAQFGGLIQATTIAHPGIEDVFAFATGVTMEEADHGAGGGVGR